VAKVERTGRDSESPPGSLALVSGVIEIATGDEWLRLRRLRLNGRYFDPAAHLDPAARLDPATFLRSL
jgi:hypothetical protein